MDMEARHAFQVEVASLQRQVFGAVAALAASIERVEALAEAIEKTLDAPPSSDLLRERSLVFSAERAADRYLEVLVG